MLATARSQSVTAHPRGVTWAAFTRASEVIVLTKQPRLLLVRFTSVGRHASPVVCARSRGVSRSPRRIFLSSADRGSARRVLHPRRVQRARGSSSPAAFLGCSVRLNLPLLAPGPSSCSLTVTLSLLHVFSPPGVLCLLLFGALLFVRWCFKPQVTLVTFSAVSDSAMFRWQSPGAAGHVCLLVPWQLSFAAFKCFILHQLCKPGPTCFTPHDTL